MTFTRNAFDAIIEALDHYAEANEVRVKITNKRKAYAGEEAGQFGVSWWAWEISDPETAEEYAYKITKAAELCRALNDAEIIADPAAAEGINTAEEYEWFVNHYYDEFINRARTRRTKNEHHKDHDSPESSLGKIRPGEHDPDRAEAKQENRRGYNSAPGAPGKPPGLY